MSQYYWMALKRCVFSLPNGCIRIQLPLLISPLPFLLSVPSVIHPSPSSLLPLYSHFSSASLSTFYILK